MQKQNCQQAGLAPRPVLIETTPNKRTDQSVSVLQPISLDTIVCIRGWENYSLIELTNGKKVCIPYTLKTFEDQNAGLLRLHRSYLVPISIIQRIRYVFDPKKEKSHRYHIEVRTIQGVDFNVSARKEETVLKSLNLTFDEVKQAKGRGINLLSKRYLTRPTLV